MNFAILSAPRKTHTAQPPRARFGLVIGLALAVVSGGPSPARAIDLAGTAWSRVATSFGVDPYLLYSVALKESAKHAQGFARPWPYAINCPGGNFYGRTLAEALQHLRSLSRETLRRCDVGLMQINVGWNGHRVTDTADLLDPVKNLTLAAEILGASLGSSPQDVQLGIGRYHTWSNEQAARSYGQSVLGIYGRLRPLASDTLSLW